MLCDIRLLLIFEDVSGKLIQYSTHGIYKPEEYFSQLSQLTPENCEEFTCKDVIQSSPLSTRTSNVCHDLVPKFFQGESLQKNARTYETCNSHAKHRFFNNLSTGRGAFFRENGASL